MLFKFEQCCCYVDNHWTGECNWNWDLFRVCIYMRNNLKERGKGAGTICILMQACSQRNRHEAKQFAIRKQYWKAVSFSSSQLKPNATDCNSDCNIAQRCVMSGNVHNFDFDCEIISFPIYSSDKPFSRFQLFGVLFLHQKPINNK